METAAELSIAEEKVSFRDPDTKLNRPILRDNFGDLEKNLEVALPDIPHTATKWGPGWVPETLKTFIESDTCGINYNNLEDFEIYDVKYDDAAQPWVFAHHKNSGITINSMARQFGKAPVQMRQWIRHCITVPEAPDRPGGSAFQYDSSITFIRPVDDMLCVVLHEMAHSLDSVGAYRLEGGEKAMSSSERWWRAYDQDTHVPDNYASVNAVENVAQNTVVAVYDENVPGGFAGIESKWQGIFHQYSTLVQAAREVGEGNSMFKPGRSGPAVHHKPASKPVPLGDESEEENTHIFGPP